MIVNNATAFTANAVMALKVYLASTTPEASDTLVSGASRLGGLLY
jgi:hypothetical protein